MILHKHNDRPFSAFAALTPCHSVQSSKPEGFMHQRFLAQAY
jgi:hypothetical protein